MRRWWQWKRHQARMTLRFRWLNRQVDILEWRVLLAAASLSASFHKYVYESVHGVIPAFTGMTSWIPACAGMTTLRGGDDLRRHDGSMLFYVTVVINQST